MSSHNNWNADVVPIQLILFNSEKQAKHATVSQPLPLPQNTTTRKASHSIDNLSDGLHTEQLNSPLTSHEKYSPEYIRRRMEAIHLQKSGSYAFPSRSGQKPALRHFVRKLMVNLRRRRLNATRDGRDSPSIDFTTAHEVALHLKIEDISVKEILKAYALMMSKYGRNRFPTNPQDYQLYLYDSASRKGRRVLSNTFLHETIATWQHSAARSRLRASMRKVIVDLAKGLHEPTSDAVAAASMGLWQLCSSNEAWHDELVVMRAAIDYLNDGILCSMKLLVGDYQKRCLLLGGLWQLISACSLVKTQELSPVLIHSLTEGMLKDGSFAAKKCVFMTLGVLLAFESDEDMTTAETVRILLECVVSCQDVGNHEGLVAALKLLCRHVKSLTKFLHEAVSTGVLHALVYYLSQFKQTPLSTTLLQVTVLVNISTHVKPGDVFAVALGSLELFDTLLRIAQRVMKIKESPSVNLLRHGVCRLLNAWLLISPYRLDAAADKSNAQGIAEFITKHVGSAQSSEHEFAATECLLNVHCWLCEAGRCARLAEVSAKVIISRLKFSKHEKSFRAITDRVREQNEYRSLLESNVLVVLLRRVADRSSRGRMKGLVRMLFGCIANTDATESTLPVSIFNSLLEVLVDDTTEHEDRQGLVCSLLVAFRNDALSSLVVESKQDYLPSLVHSLRYFVDDFSDPYFEMLLYIIWGFVEKLRDSSDMSATNKAFCILLAHLHGSVERIRSIVLASPEKTARRDLVNISFESEVHLWSVVSFKRSLLELDAAGAKQRVSRILGFYETRDEAVEALIAYESAAEEKRLKRVFKDKGSVQINGKIRLRPLDEPSIASDRVRMLLNIIWSMYLEDKEGCSNVLCHPESAGILFYLGLSNRITCPKVKRIVGRLLWDIIMGYSVQAKSEPSVAEEMKEETQHTTAETHNVEEEARGDSTKNMQDPLERKDEEDYSKRMIFGKPREYYVTRFVHMMTMFTQSEVDSLQADAAFYLATLSRRPDCRRIVSRHGGIPALKCIVKSASLRSTTGFNAVVGLGLLCYSRTNQEIISSNGGLETLITVCQDTVPEDSERGAPARWGDFEECCSSVGEFEQQRVARWILFVLKQNSCNATRLYKAELEGQDVPVPIRREWTFDPHVQSFHKHEDGYSVTVTPYHQNEANAISLPRRFNFTSRSRVKEVERIELDDAEAVAMKEAMYCFKKVRGSTLLPKLPTFVAPDGKTFHLCLSGLPEHPCKKIVQISAGKPIRCPLEEFLGELKLSVETGQKFGSRPQSREDLHALHSFWTPPFQPGNPPLPQSMYRFYNVITQPTHSMLQQVGKSAGKIIPQGNLRFYCVRAVKRSRWSLIKRSFFTIMPDPIKLVGAKGQDEFTSIIATYVNTIRRDRSIMRKDFKHILNKPSVVQLVKGSVETVQWTLCEHASLVLAMFRYFAAHRAEPESAFVLTREDFQSLIVEMNLRGHESLPLKTIDEIFEHSCDRSELALLPEAPAESGSLEGKVQQHEFIEAMIRLAALIYQDSPLAVALHLLIAERFWGRFATERVLDLDAFRYMVLHSDDVNDSLIRHKQTLVSLFEHFAGKVRTEQDSVQDSDKIRLSLSDWLEFVTQFKLVNDLNVSIQDCILCFALTLLNTSSEAQSREKREHSFSLDFTRFSEALCRLCDVMAVPPGDVLEQCSTLPESYAFMRCHGIKPATDMSSIRLQTSTSNQATNSKVKHDLGKKLSQLLPLIENQLSSILLDENSKHVLDEKYHMTVEVACADDDQNV